MPLALATWTHNWLTSSADYDDARDALVHNFQGQADRLLVDGHHICRLTVNWNLPSYPGLQVNSEHSAWLNYFAVLDCFPRNSVNQAPEQARVCPQEIQDRSADSCPYFSKYHKTHFMITMLKMDSNPHICHKPFPVHKPPDY
ncbi:hypothetical protein DUI87_08234 [Hirundo rustica rustica]|uniref:Uncharacterized protein n=1 Tax=Hirundo rustica rustica TaxID=333673 RepID=A0A3M0L9V6_HIRRU|nr:hypothetical protein DUI87_08234 [Hirundo rustica rustica]